MRTARPCFQTGAEPLSTLDIASMQRAALHEHNRRIHHDERSIEGASRRPCRCRLPKQRQDRGASCGIQNPQQAGAGNQQPGGLGGLLGGLGGSGGLGGLLGGLTSGGIVSGGLGDLLKTFQQNGHGDKVESWVQPGPNADIDDGQLAEALGPDVLNGSLPIPAFRIKRFLGD